MNNLLAIKRWQPRTQWIQFIYPIDASLESLIICLLLSSLVLCCLQTIPPTYPYPFELMGSHSQRLKMCYTSSYNASSRFNCHWLALFPLFLGVAWSTSTCEIMHLDGCTHVGLACSLWRRQDRRYGTCKASLLYACAHGASGRPSG